MKADAIPLYSLFEVANRAYVIPLYQRPFAWPSSKAIDLLDGVLQDSLSGKSKLTSLGAVLFCEVGTSPHPYGNSTPSTIAPNTIWEVVDGQQRMTVFTIIGYALKRRYDELVSEGLTYAPSRDLVLLYSTSRTTSGARVPNLIRDGDNFDSAFESDISRLLSSYIRTTATPTSINESIRLAHNDINEWVKDNLDKSNYGEFTEYLLQSCKVIQVLADDQDTAFAMFEPLNSTSEPLTAFEVYRSKVVRKISPVPDFVSTINLLDYEKSDRDAVIRRSNNIIFISAQAYCGERPRRHFLPLKVFLDSHIDTGFIDNFELISEFYKTIWLEQTCSESWFDEETKNCVSFLKAANHDICIPILAIYYVNDKKSISNVVKVLVAFFSLWRANFPTNKLPQLYRALMTDSSKDDMSIKNGKIKSVSQLSKYFREALDSQIDKEFGSAANKFDKWKDCRLLNYESLKVICRLFVFIDMSSSIKSNYVPNDPWTNLDDIEHIASISKNATLPNLHHIGNLTFLPPEVNRSLKDSGWKDKKEMYKLLAQPMKPKIPAKLKSGEKMPDGINNYLNDKKSIALVHLDELTKKSSWKKTAIDARSLSMKNKVWNILYKDWLS